QASYKRRAGAGTQASSSKPVAEIPVPSQRPVSSAATDCVVQKYRSILGATVGPEDLQLKNYRGMLQEASYNGDYSCVKTIIDKGANVNEASPMSPLMWAAQAGHESVVRLLLDHGASVDFGADNGNTALGYASSGQSP